MNQPLRVLAPEAFHSRLSRRAFLKSSAAAAGCAVLFSACRTTSLPTISMYTWSDYNDPEVVGSLTEDALGSTMRVDYYSSNEDLITKLSMLSSGASGFDIVVPTGPYIPQMIEKGLIQKLDMSKIPNFANLDPAYISQDWDPNNTYSVCKNWGSTGYFYNKTKITRKMETWQDFIDACMNEGSGDCAVLDTGPNLCGMWYWANGYDWNDQDTTKIDACEAFLVNEFAQHLKAFDSSPGAKLAEGAYSLAMGWNGDLRRAYTNIAEAGGDVSEWVFVLGAPATELWMDTYCIAAGAPNPDGAHAWINWNLSPEISIADLQYHGYNTGLRNIDALIEQWAPDLDRREMMFFSPEQIATFQTQQITPLTDRMVDIFNKVKAKAGG